MKHPFTLPDFPDSVFEIETSIWSGKPVIYRDGAILPRSKEDGEPFLIVDAAGQDTRAYPKMTILDLIPALEINGITYQTVEKLTWYQYIIALLPMTMIIVGGLLGGVIGAVASLFNLQLFRTEGSDGMKYLKVIGTTVFAFILYFVVFEFFK